MKITSYSFQAVVKKNKIQKSKRSNYHYELDVRHRYSDAFIEWFVNNLNQSNWLDGALKSYRNGRKKA